MDRLEFAAEMSVEGDTLHGVVHVFGTRTLRDGIWHQMSPSVFEDVSGVLAYYAHDTAKPLGKPALEIVGKKLMYGLRLGNQSYANDLRENMAQGVMNFMSFGMIAQDWKDSRQKDGSTVRLHTKSNVYDISPVSMPAFSGTAAMLNAGDPLDNERAAALIRHNSWRMQHG